MSSPLTVLVKIIEAKELLAADKGNTSDPFVKLSVSKEKFQTAVVEKTLSPTWNEEFVFGSKKGLSNPLPTLAVSLFDNDRFSNDTLGSVEIALDALARNEVVGMLPVFAASALSADVLFIYLYIFWYC